jgi:multiple sugar transport system substrate-binding protein
MKETYSRRRYIVLSATGTIAGVTGCLGGNENGSSDGDGGNESDGDGGGGRNGSDESNGSSGGNASGGSNGSAGGSSGENPSELPPVHWLTDYNSDAWQSRWNEFASTFTEETGIDTNIEFVGGSGEGEQRLANLIQAGDPPDVMTTVTPSVADLFTAGTLAPVNDTLGEITSAAGELTVEPVLNDSEGTRYQVPHGYYIATLLYREDIYEALDLSEPSNFMELKENARIIDESDEFDTRGMAVPAAQDEPLASAAFRIMYNNMGYARVRWKSDAREEVEIWFPKEPAVELLNYFKELAQYSPDPSQVTFVSGLSNWGGGAYGQLVHLNLWPGGTAAGIDPEIAKNTGVTNMPLYQDVPKEESRMTLNANIDGHFVLDSGANTPGSKRLLKWLYGRDAETTAEMYAQEPMRFLPTYAEILGTDTYADFDHFQEFPGHLEKLKKIEDIGNEYYNNVESTMTALSTGPATYMGRVFLLSRMIHDAVVVGDDPAAVVDEHKSAMEERLQEGKERFS